jgi:uncharacterized RDD family membrane protein YckC
MTFFELMNEPIVQLLVIIFASWRLSFMIVSEDGAFSLTYAIRLLGVRVVTPDVTKFQAWKENLKPEGKTVQLAYSNHFGKLVGCIMCMSVWVSLFALLGMYYYHYFPIALFYQTMAISGVVIIIQKKGFSR